MRGHFSFSVAVVAMLGAGCGGGGGSGPTFSTSVPSGSAVNTLTPAQLTQLCNDIASFTSKELSSTSICQAATARVVAQQAAQNPGLSDAELQVACANEMSLVCILVVDAGVPGSPDGGASSCASGANCTATVGQISTCLNDQSAAIARYESMFPTCSAVTHARLAAIDLDAGIAQPASCIALQSSCPSFSSSMP
jgi:hypothetical protein